MTEVLASSLLNGFGVADEAAVLEKLERFMDGGPDDVHVALDFDKTLTFTDPEADGHTTSWRILQDNLPPEGILKQQELYDKYYPLERNGTMTHDDAMTWWNSALGLFVEYGLNLGKVERQFMQRANIRAGVRELFDACDEQGLPTVVLSAGVKNVIDMWMARYAISPSVVVSTELILDPAQRIIGWDSSTVVHSLNKDEIDHPELTRIRAARTKTIVVGDSMQDANMAVGEEDVLRVRVFNPEPGSQPDFETFRQQSLEHFDLVIETGSMMPLTGLVRALSARHKLADL